ncbi:MAG: 2'-5' RNA ligase family protein [Weeksellaceae bacterium]|nr:2'-5' RNA ligase family protein [Weeksellaceae bacterium]
MSLYFVAIQPPHELSSKLRLISKDFAERFGSSKAYRNFPHITIIPPFQFDDTNESIVVGRFMKIQPTVKPFNLRLSKFNCFPNKKHPVIFVEPENNEDLKKLYAEVNSAICAFNYAEHFNPHLTVAYRDLSYENFEKAWEEYSGKTMDESFEVSRVVLFKHYGGKWNEIAHRDFPTQ